MGTNSTILKRDLAEWLEHCQQIRSSTALNLNETKAIQEARIKRAKKDYNFFFKTYLPIYAKVDCADFQVELANELVTKKRIDKNVIACAELPREHGKSVHCDVGIPMYMIAHGTLSGMILMGKNEADACNLLSDLQAQLESNELFINDFGDQKTYGDWQEGDFTTKSGIRFLAIGRDQSPRGARKGEKRPNYAVIDDVDDDEIVYNQKRVRKVIDRIFGALFFALDTAGSTMVLAGNRIHPQSILAHFVGDIKPGAPKRPGLFHQKIFAIDPKTGQPAWHQNYTLEQINSKIEKAGRLIGRREFFHENHVEGTIFKDSMFHFVKVPPLRSMTIIIGYCDPSFENKPTSDFKAVRIWAWHGEKKYCLKSFVRRTDMNEVFNFMSDQEDRLPAGVGIIWYIEKQFFNRPIQDALYQHNKMREKAGKKKLHVITDNRIKENKYTRIVKMEPDYTSGNVFYNIDELHNPDMQEGNNQLKAIEPGYNTPDDSPDADEGAKYYGDQHIPGRNFKPMIARRRERSTY